jgi:hypothetical protein
MTTTLPAPPAATSARPTPFTGCPIQQRALSTGARDLADALTGVAFDAPCRPDRQRILLDFSASVLRAVRGSGDAVLAAACEEVDAAGPLFAANISAGAPRLAGAWIRLADLLQAAAAGPHDHDVVSCAREFRAVAGQPRFAVPWFADACSPRERVELVSTAPRRVRLALRLAEDRWLTVRATVRG